MGQERKRGTQAHLSVSLLFIPHFDVFCDPLEPRQHRIFLLYTIPWENAVNGDITYSSVLQKITSENQSKYVYDSIVSLISLSPKNPNSPQFVIMCHLFMPQCSKHLLREILPVNHMFGV